MKIFTYGTLLNQTIQLREFGQTFSVEDETSIVEDWKTKECFLDDDFYKFVIP